MSSSFPYQPANPFSTASTSPSRVPYRFSVSTGQGGASANQTHLDALIGKLQGTRKAAIVGPHGTGKSTLLHTLLPMLQRGYPKVAFHALNNDPSLGYFARVRDRRQASGRIRAEMTDLPEGGLLVIDGWEQLTRSSRWRITKMAASCKVTLLVTAHTRLSGWTILHETRASSELIRTLAKDLLKDSPYRVQKLVDGHLKSRRLHARTNVRNLWFEMYDIVQDHEKEQHDHRTDSFMQG